MNRELEFFREVAPYDLQTTSITIDPDLYHHVAVVFNGDKSVLYINGILVFQYTIIWK